MSESLMTKGHQLAIRRQALQRLAPEGDIVAIYVIKNCGLEDKEPAIDPPLL
jgi:hypothetical protein